MGMDNTPPKKNLAKDDDMAHVVAGTVVWVKKLGRGEKFRKRWEETNHVGGVTRMHW
jgi:hypothetical protein